MFIALLNRDFESIQELEKYLNYCRAEYVEQCLGNDVDFSRMSVNDEVQLYNVLALEEQRKEKERK